MNIQIQNDVADHPETLDMDLQYIADLVKRKAGLHMPPSKAPMMKARLQRRLRSLQISALPDYCSYLRNAESDHELNELIKALTTNVTNFYREKHHFDYMREKLLPNLIAAARKGERVRIWSAGCSTGEEPTSMAIDIIADFPDALHHDIRILATDIDENVLRHARQGVYSAEGLEPLHNRHGRDHTNIVSSNNNLYSIREDARKLICYKRLNFLDDWPFGGPFQIVFCRNVVIYFDIETQKYLWPKFRRVLDNGSYLFLGHSERLEQPESYGATSVTTTGYRFN